MPFGEFQLKATLLFEQELTSALDYAETQLRNPQAADKLQDDVEAAVRERLRTPWAFESVPSREDRELPYYRIYIGNHIVFYCVIGNVMELRRFVYGKRNWQTLLK